MPTDPVDAPDIPTIPYSPDRVEVHAGPSHFFLDYESSSSSWRLTQVSNTESGLLFPDEFATRGRGLEKISDLLAAEPNAWPSDLPITTPRYVSPDPAPDYPVIKEA